ncbi:hypothetical protein FOZ63_001931 [Perkinsus olseni]|uniref:Uncharacterized protein n=1 Tax=Perkinsus olseni TaxID=32597 RepID=A0A7J6SLX9_PEROL|nr:hypothetical protein FOZ63_001931 [Perkinsus olseni]
MSPKHHSIMEVSAMVAALVVSLLPLGDAIGAAAKGDGYPQLSSHRQFKPINGDTTVHCEFGHEILGGGKRVTLFEVNFRENDMSTSKVRCPEAGDRPGFEIGYLWGAVFRYTPDAPGGAEGPLYSFRNVPLPEYDEDPLATLRWSDEGAFRRLESISSASNEDTKKICLAGIAALKKKIRTYTDLCAENYQTAMRAFRAGGSKVKVFS